MTINKHDALIGTFGLLCVASSISSVALLSNGLLTDDETTRKQSYNAATGLCFVALLAGVAFIQGSRNRVIVPSIINIHSGPQIRIFELKTVEDASTPPRRLSRLPSQEAPAIALDMPVLVLPEVVSNTSPETRRASFNR